MSWTVFRLQLWERSFVCDFPLLSAKFGKVTDSKNQRNLTSATVKITYIPTIPYFLSVGKNFGENGNPKRRGGSVAEMKVSKLQRREREQTLVTRHKHFGGIVPGLGGGQRTVKVVTCLPSLQSE